MGRYEVYVKIEIRECDDAVDQNPVEQADGSFRMVIPDKTASSIDECEQALLRTNFAAVRQAIAAHLTERSKKKQQNMPKDTPRPAKK
jgi:hypothetical protein